MKKYDFGLSWSIIEKSFFTGEFIDRCRKKGLSYIWISADKLKKVLRDIETGRIRIKVWGRYIHCPSTC